MITQRGSPRFVGAELKESYYNQATSRDHGRDLEGGEMIPEYLHCLGVTKAGEPIHPLYVSYAVQPQVWKSSVGESPEVFNAK
jgi:hypothetical protein